jgi:acetoacetyl-[acyl-carrier protein] synthase
VGFGGINPAGRISSDHAYRRMVIERLAESDRAETYQSLATLMNVSDDPSEPGTRAHIDQHTLIRKIESHDTDHVPFQRTATLHPDQNGHDFTVSKRQMPESVPSSWVVNELPDGDVRVHVPGKLNVLFPDNRPARVTSAGQLPTGFDPGAIYASRNHPRGLQLTVFGASDALRSSGLRVQTLKRFVRPDEFAVYSGSAMAQLDDEGYGGLLRNHMVGKRPSAKNTPLGLPEMPGDFINAYVLGSVGGTAGIIGACATFLYNIKQGMEEIRNGTKRLVLAGNAEAPILPDVIEGYRVMGALAEDEAIRALDGSETTDHRRACRPFSSNCGFTVAESSVYAVLMDDELAMDLGANILCSIGDVFVNADGFKKSIPGPGVGNYITVAKAMATARAILGDNGLKNRTYMQAHGTGTPQNRVTESAILNQMAQTYGISDWLTGAIKAYVGHSMAPAGGDQLAAILGAWKYGWVPGITTIDHIADDVHHDYLHLPFDHVEIDPEQMQGAFINSKGFGGNNATGLFLSPTTTQEMLTRKWGAAAMRTYADRNEAVKRASHDYDQTMLKETVSPIYQFGEGVLEGGDLDITTDQIQLPGFELPVELSAESPYPDMHLDD